MSSTDLQGSSEHPGITERRSASRLQRGDTKRCPSCAAGWLEFNERARGVGSDGITPAWLCTDCGHQQAVRR